MTDRATTGPTEAEELALRRLILGRYDDEAARVVIGRVVPRLAAFLRGRFPTLAPEDAEDLAREALTVAMERRDVFDPDRDTKVTTWLHGIAKLRAADLFRKRVADARLAEEWEGAEARDYGVIDTIVGQTSASVAADRAEAELTEELPKPEGG